MLILRSSTHLELDDSEDNSKAQYHDHKNDFDQHVNFPDRLSHRLDSWRAIRRVHRILEPLLCQ